MDLITFLIFNTYPLNSFTFIPVVHYHPTTGKVIDVYGFHDSLGSVKDIVVGTAITTIDLEDETIIGVFPQIVYFGKSMKDSLLPPAQMWDHGMIVDVVPK